MGSGSACILCDRSQARSNQELGRVIRKHNQRPCEDNIGYKPIPRQYGVRYREQHAAGHRQLVPRHDCGPDHEGNDDNVDKYSGSHDVIISLNQRLKQMPAHERGIRQDRNEHEEANSGESPSAYKCSHIEQMPDEEGRQANDEPTQQSIAEHTEKQSGSYHPMASLAVGWHVQIPVSDNQPHRN